MKRQKKNLLIQKTLDKKVIIFGNLDSQKALYECLKKEYIGYRIM